MLRGKSVFLRLIEKDDAVLIFSWENNEEIKKVTRIESTLSIQMIDALIEEQMNVWDSGQIRFLICKADTGTPLGTATPCASKSCSSVSDRVLSAAFTFTGFIDPT